MLCFQALDALVCLEEGAARRISEGGGARAVVKTLRKHAFPVEDSQELVDLRQAGHALLLRTTVREPTPAGGPKHDGRWLGKLDKGKSWPERGMKPPEAREVLTVYRRHVGVLRWEEGVAHGLRVLEAKLRVNPPAAQIQAAVDSYEALGEAMINPHKLEEVRPFFAITTHTLLLVDCTIFWMDRFLTQQRAGETHRHEGVNRVEQCLSRMLQLNFAKESAVQQRATTCAHWSRQLRSRS
jgi:hypothetical protein